MVLSRCSSSRVREPIFHQVRPVHVCYHCHASTPHSEARRPPSRPPPMRCQPFFCVNYTGTAASKPQRPTGSAASPLPSPRATLNLPPSDTSPTPGRIRRPKFVFSGPLGKVELRPVRPPPSQVRVQTPSGCLRPARALARTRLEGEIDPLHFRICRYGTALPCTSCSGLAAR